MPPSGRGTGVQGQPAELAPTQFREAEHSSQENISVPHSPLVSRTASGATSPKPVLIPAGWREGREEMQACRHEKVGRGPGARAGRALGGLKGAAQMVGVPCAVGEQEAEGKVSSQILVSSDSQSATGLGTQKGRGLASPGGSHLGQQRGPSLRAPLGPSRVSSWTGLQGAPSIFLPQDPGHGRSG